MILSAPPPHMVNRWVPHPLSWWVGVADWDISSMQPIVDELLVSLLFCHETLVCDIADIGFGAE